MVEVGLLLKFYVVSVSVRGEGVDLVVVGEVGAVGVDRCTVGG